MNYIKMIIFSGSASLVIAKKVAKHKNQPLGEIEVKKFPDSEIYVRIISCVKDKNCVVIQSCKTNEDIIELLIILDALNDLGAKHITTVIPYIAYARQDKRFKSGEAMSAKTILKLINNSSDRIINVNCHFLNEQGTFNVAEHFNATSEFYKKNMKSDDFSKISDGNFDKISRFFEKKSYYFDDIGFNEKLKVKGSKDTELFIENLDAFTAVAKYFENELDNKNLVVIAPDKGALNNAKRAAGVIGCEFDYLDKTRISGNKVIIKPPKNLDIRNKDVLILDDMISTGGTIAESAKILKSCGAKTITVGCVHGVFSEGIKMFEGVVDGLVCSNTLETGVSKVDVSGIIADRI
ncbi:MAG: hypothetical protein CVT90_01785 [Candidatus Altiarchaeales archaeon HGW-Altiarchaeales-3]|nr:MAG: hypothetical protein CVT90_01785 [Candidatus Altiarchaeales archaeon HGW-Altiarchaeales-3]